MGVLQKSLASLIHSLSVSYIWALQKPHITPITELALLPSQNKQI